MATLNLKKKKFIDEDALKKIVAIGINFGERLNSIESKCIASYDETHSYLKDELCIYDNYIYKCNSTATGTWNPDRWTLIGDDITELTLDEIKAMLGLTTEQLTTLSSIILDSEVRLDKTYSSSKIYTSIQDAIDTSKAYTLAEIGKASGASYKIASSTSDMTDEKVIYLLQNDSTYDMYIVDGGTPVKIGDTNIDLSDCYTKAEIDNDFLKKTDATSTYATKVELVDKVDKTDIVDNLTSIDTNKPLSANQGKILDDKKLNKTDITTTIDSSSTDTQVPSAKAIYNEFSDKMKDFYVYMESNTALSKYGVDDITNLTSLLSLTSKLNPLSNSRYTILIHAANNQTFYNCGITPVAESGLLVITTGNYRGKAIFTTDNGSIYVSTTSSSETDTWRKWKKVCTTSVADVPKTAITFSNKTNYKNLDDAFSYYYVQNGICYLSICLQCVSPLNVSTRIECTSDIPKPKISIRKIVTPWESTNYNVAPIFFCLENTRQNAFIMGGNVGTNYLLQFSYPVAES